MVGDHNKVTLNYTGGDRGWKGDVPIVRLNTDKIKKLGWQCQYNSHQAITKSIDDMLKQNPPILANPKTHG